MKLIGSLTSLRFIFLISTIILFCKAESLFSPVHGKVMISYNTDLLGAYILDLSGGAQEIAIYASQWTLQGALNPTASHPYTCSSWRLFGQPGLLSNDGYFERTYSSLSPHSFVFYSIPLFIMDQWVSSDYYEIFFDDVSIFRGDPYPLKNLYAGNYCANPTKTDLIDSVMGRFPHTNSTLTLKIVSHISNSPTNGWLGLTDLAITLSNHSSVTEVACSNAHSLTTSRCAACGVGTYPDPGSPGSCLACHSSCFRCFGPSITDCLFCNHPYSYDGTVCRSHGSANCIYFDFNQNKCARCSTTTSLSWDGSCTTSCNLPYTVQTLASYSFCVTPCQLNSTFMLWDNTCTQFCDPPLVQRVAAYAKFCDFPCSPTSLYLYSNGSCLSSCDFFGRVLGGYKFCDDCPGSSLLYPNHTCLSTCPSPRFTTGEAGYNYCVSPCQSNNTYLLWDNTCVGVCDSLFVSRNEGTAKFCDFPCSNDQYLYPNGSCLPFCDFYVRSEGIYKFCENCTNSYFLQPDRTCSSTCLLPKIARSEGGYNFCVSPCENKMEYYYKKEDWCGSCGSPYKVEDTIFCVLDISEETAKTLDTVSGGVNITSQVTSVAITLFSLVSFSNPAAVLFGTMTDLIQYIKYLNIAYPPKLQYLLDQPESEGILQGILSIPVTVEDYFTKQGLSEIFEKYGLHSSFFVNFWETFFIFSVIGIIIALIHLTKLLTKKYPSLQSILAKLQKIFQWNFLISQSMMYAGDLAFYSVLEISTVHFDSFWSVLSFVLALTTNIMLLVLLIKVVIVLTEIVDTKNQDSKSLIFKRINVVKEKFKQYEIIFESCKEDTFPQQAFLLFCFFRLYVFNFFLAALPNQPQIQIKIFTLLSFAMFLYIIIKRPFKERKEFIENIVQEIALQIINLCILMLAFLDATESGADEAREILGFIIMGVNTGFTILGSVYLNIQLTIGLKDTIVDFLKQRKKSKEAQKIVGMEIKNLKELEDVNPGELDLKQTTFYKNQLFQRLEMQSNRSSANMYDPEKTNNLPGQDDPQNRSKRKIKRNFNNLVKTEHKKEL